MWRRLKHFIPRWDTLQTAGESSTIRSSYVWIVCVPIAARLLERVNSAATFSVLGEKLSIQLHLPFSWELFFFSSLCFATATTLYTLFCPTIVKQFSGFPKFYDAGFRGQQLLGYLYRIVGNPRHMESRWPSSAEEHWIKDFLRSFGDQDTKASAEHLPLTVKSRPLNPYTKYSIPEDALQDAFWAVWYKGTVARQKVRLVTTLFYGAGFLLLFTVLLQNIVFVSRHMF